MRTHTHIIDTKAVKKVVGTLPDYWVVRELTERDYGIDLMVEIFVPGHKDKKNMLAYDASGAVFHIQIKGTGDEIEAASKGTINYSIYKKSLLYVEKFNVPFFLFRVDVSSQLGKIYFIWIQRYIRDVLDVDTPLWREESEEKITVRLPVANVVTSSIERIQRIAFRPKYLEELVEYREIFSDLQHRLPAILAGQHVLNDEVIADIRNKAYRVRRLNVLLAQNDFCIDHSCIDEFILYLDHLNMQSIASNEVLACPHEENFRLLAASLEDMGSIENFVQENEGRTAY